MQDNIHFLTSESQYRSFMESFEKDLKRDAGRVASNKSLTEVDMVGNPHRWVIMRKEFRPGHMSPVTPETRYVNVEDTYELRRIIPESRMENNPPFQQDTKILRPQTDIMSTEDHVVFRPNATRALEQIGAIDFDAIEKDVDATFNVDTRDLGSKAQEGIIETKRSKSDVMKRKRHFDHQLASAWEDTLGYHPSQNPSFDSLDLDDRFAYYRNQVRDMHASEPRILKEEGLNLSRLESIYDDILVGADETEDIGVEAFSETIDDGGMGLPSTVEGGTAEAIGRLRIGSKEYLNL